MPKVTVTFNGRTYDIACGIGEEARVQELAGEIRRRMEGMAKNAGSIQETQLFALTALLLADELDQRGREVERAKREQELAMANLRNEQDARLAAAKQDWEKEIAALRHGQTEAAQRQAQAAEEREGRIADTIDRLAERMETIAARLAAA